MSPVLAVQAHAERYPVVALLVAVLLGIGVFGAGIVLAVWLDPAATFSSLLASTGVGPVVCERL